MKGFSPDYSTFTEGRVTYPVDHQVTKGPDDIERKVLYVLDPDSGEVIGEIVPDFYTKKFIIKKL